MMLFDVCPTTINVILNTKYIQRFIFVECMDNIRLLCVLYSAFCVLSAHNSLAYSFIHHTHRFDCFLFFFFTFCICSVHYNILAEKIVWNIISNTLQIYIYLFLFNLFFIIICYFCFCCIFLLFRHRLLLLFF